MRRHLPLAAALALLVPAAACKTSPEPPCPSGQVKCGLACVDTATNDLHCGACNQPCGLGACVGGACQCDVGAGAAACPPGHFPRCADTQHDAAQCGAACATCKPGAACDLGTCACPAGTTDCPAGCFDTQADARNCGGCGIACLPGETCEAGLCTCAPQPPKTRCADLGCFDLSSDRNHCGTTCGNAAACPAGATCAGGACQCPAGKTLCGGACVDLSTDEANCGHCGGACAAGATCTAGACSCPAARPDTCGVPGVCVDKLTDSANCGGCGVACGSGRACQAGTCCADGQVACSGGLGGCCPGTACCSGGACQPLHTTGLGQTYFSCTPLGTLSEATAQAAANAWLPSGGIDITAVQDCAPSTCFCRQGTGSAATFCWAGPLAGQSTLNTISTSCLCPPLGTTSGTWN